MIQESLRHQVGGAAFQNAANNATGAVGVTSTGTFPNIINTLSLPAYAEITAQTDTISSNSN